jgi:homogentisate 1,2-dioxygenase
MKWFTPPTHLMSIGWDGYNFPYGFSVSIILNRLPDACICHLLVHQTFETACFRGLFFLCQGLYDYHPKSIPAPYNHSNIDSDEVLYYVDGDFMSSNNIEARAYNIAPKRDSSRACTGSDGAKHWPDRLRRNWAVMVDTFRPLMVTEEAMGLDDGKYYKSWVE